MAQAILRIKMFAMKNLFAISFLSALLLCGCAPSFEPQGRSIALAVSFGEVVSDNELQTKAETQNGSGVKAIPFAGTPSADNRLNTALWFSTELGKYSHNPTAPTYLPCATTFEYTSSTSTDIKTTADDILQYPIPVNGVSQNVYCVGFYPSDNWGAPISSDPVSSASHVINGSEDLMFAEQIVGNYSVSFKTQTYNHLLTWVKINLSAKSLAATKVWGDIESLTIVSPNRQVNVTFPTTESGTSTVRYSENSVPFPLALPDNKALNLTTRTFAQAFCSPPAPAAKNAGGIYEYVESSGAFGYIVRVKATNLPEKEVFVKLMKEDNITPIPNAEYAKGKLFVINLHFNDVPVVEGVCTLKQWDDQSSDIYFDDKSGTQTT